MSTVEEIKTKMRAELQAADAISKKAEQAGRDMTPAELDLVNTHLNAYEAMKPELKETRDAAQVKHALDSLNAEFMGDSDPAPAFGGGRKDRAAAEWAKAAESAFGAVMRGPEGQKALVSGTVDVPSILQPSQLPARPLTVLDLIRIDPNEGDGNGNQVQWLRQTARPNNAAAVADGGLKPTGVGTFQDVEDRFRQYAILSEVLPIRYLTDYRGLTDILRVQLGEAVLTAFEQDILTGAATGAPGGSTENVVGILNTSGIQTQAWSATVAGVDPRFETTLKASTKVQTIGLTEPTAFVLNPTDWEAISLAQLAKNPQNTGDRQSARMLHGIPVVLNLGLPAGTGLVGDWREITAKSRDRAKVDVDTTGGEKFQRNQFQMRHESRFALQIGRPNAFCKITLTTP